MYFFKSVYLFFQYFGTDIKYILHVNSGDYILMENPENKILSKKYAWAHFIIYLKIIGCHQKVYKS